MICSSVNRLLRMASPWISCPGTLTSAGSGLGDKLSDSVARLRLSSPVRHSNASSQRVTTMRATPRWQGALARSVGVLVGAVSRKGATRCAGLAGGGRLRSMCCVDTHAVALLDTGFGARGVEKAGQGAKTCDPSGRGLAKTKTWECQRGRSALGASLPINWKRLLRSRGKPKR
jgi:hypothetical protein